MSSVCFFKKRLDKSRKIRPLLVGNTIRKQEESAMNITPRTVKITLKKRVLKQKI